MTIDQLPLWMQIATLLLALLFLIECIAGYLYVNNDKSSRQDLKGKILRAIRWPVTILFIAVIGYGLYEHEWGTSTLFFIVLVGRLYFDPKFINLKK